MRRHFILRLCAMVITILLARSIFAQKPELLVDIDHRPAMSLDGEWHYILDPMRNGWKSNSERPSSDGFAKNEHPVAGGPLVQYDFATSPTLHVPGDWNTQDPNLFAYEGLLWYEKDFNYRKKPGTRLFLHFGAADYKSDIFVNDIYVCGHEGAFTPFDCDVTDAVKDGYNFVVAAVDNTRKQEYVPTLRFGWWNFGGLTRGVSLVEVPNRFIDDYELELSRGDSHRIAGYVHVAGAGAGESVTLLIPELGVRESSSTNEDGRASFAFAARELKLWSPESPKLYGITMTAGKDKLKDEIGFRTIAVQGDKILLNGKPIFLRGVNIQNEAPYRGGRSYSQKDADTLLGWARELDCNFVRLAHFPNPQNMLRTTDRMGLLVWSEVPVYWNIDWNSPHALAVAQQQLAEMIRRDRNKASVILWSVSNETIPGEARNVFLRKLIADARQQDPTRLVTSAISTPFQGTSGVLDDPIAPDLDVLGYNEYIGWYNGLPEDTPKYTWSDPLGKPLIFSELGGGAKAGIHGSVNQKFTEEYQANIYKEQIAMFKRVPFLAGVCPWVLMDFRDPERFLVGIQDLYNRKGLVSDKGEKKMAFKVLQKFYRSKQDK